MTADPITGRAVPAAPPPGAEVDPATVAEPPVPRTGAVRLTLVLTYLCAFATPWNGWIIAGLRPGDFLLLLALVGAVAVTLASGVTWPSLPRWVWGFGAVILAVTFLHVLSPTDPIYLAQRVVVDQTGTRVAEVESNLTVGLKFVVPVVGLPLLFALARQLDPRALFRCAFAFALGSAVSSLIAFTDSRGFTSISQSITGIGAFDGRAPGLSGHPNFLATTCVLGLPIVLWRVTSSRPRERLANLILILVLVLGVYASGSRGGAAVLVGSAVLTFALLPAYRRILPLVALIAALVVSVVFVVHPSAGLAVLSAVRLTSDNSSADGSDVVRREVREQGLADFAHSPLDGVGLQVAAEAHNVYLQALASGGVLLLGGYLIFIFAGLIRGYRLMKRTPLGHPFFVAALAGALLSIVENALTDRLAYVPIALIAAMPLTALHVDGDTDAHDEPTGLLALD